MKVAGWPEGYGRRVLPEVDSTNAEAARVAERVKAPATAVPGTSRTSITSVRPWYRTPAAMVAKRTPSITGSCGK